MSDETDKAVERLTARVKDRTGTLSRSPVVDDVDAVLTEFARMREENERLVREAEGRARADASYRKRWKEHSLLSEVDEIRRHVSGLRPRWAEALAELQSGFLHSEEENAAARKAINEACEELRVAARQNEMSANIMRDPQRTGNWRGAERTAAAFDRHGLKVAGIRAKLINATNISQEERR